jgi:hypothetical protein
MGCQDLQGNPGIPEDWVIKTETVEAQGVPTQQGQGWGEYGAEGLWAKSQGDAS